VSASTLLDDLRRLRAIQVAQAEALARGDVEVLEALSDERMTLQAGVRPLDTAGLSPADLAEAQALVQVLTIDQVNLVSTATRVRDELRGEISGLTRGRTAVAGYRPHATSRSVYLDSEG
jgi:hypothetical protein